MSNRESVHSRVSLETTLEPSPSGDVDDYAPLAPVQDYKLYSEQLLCIAKAVELEVLVLDPRSSDKILSRLYADSPSVIALLLLQRLKDPELPSFHSSYP